jgi:predicted O-methyltransferase YrrM
MIYRSKLVAPDLYPAFEPRVICKPRSNSLKHDVLSDPEREPECGFLTHDEAAILYNVAGAFPGHWLDIGGAAGWSTAHLLDHSSYVVAIDPLYLNGKFRERAIENLWSVAALWPTSSSEFVLSHESAEEYFLDHLFCNPFDGVLIDGDHEGDAPLNDARNAAANMAARGVIVLHDVLSGAVQAAVRWLVENGFNLKLYWTPHMMAVCWRGEYDPPAHRADPVVVEALFPQMQDWIASLLADHEYLATEHVWRPRAA